MRRTQREAAADEGCNRMQRRTEKGFANSNCGLCHAAEQSQRNYSTKSEEVARGEQHGERREPARGCSPRPRCPPKTSRCVQVNACCQCAPFQLFSIKQLPAPLESLSSAAADFCLMSSAAHFDIDALPFAQRMQAVLHGPLLPHVINLGQYNYSIAGVPLKQEYFKAMTAEEVQRLALRLQSQPHVTHLNLWGHAFGPEGMRLLAGPIAMQTSLHTLNLRCT